VEGRYRFDLRIQSLFGVVEVMHRPIWMVGGLMSASTRRQEIERTPQILMVNPTFSSEMMFGSNYEGYYHSDQLLLLGSEAGASHGRSTIRLLVWRRETGSDPDELVRQIIVIAVRVAYP
jgi:hypothetical protein